MGRRPCLSGRQGIHIELNRFDYMLGSGVDRHFTVFARNPQMLLWSFFGLCWLLVVPAAMTMRRRAGNALSWFRGLSLQPCAALERPGDAELHKSVQHIVMASAGNFVGASGTPGGWTVAEPAGGFGLRTGFILAEGRRMGWAGAGRERRLTPLLGHLRPRYHSARLRRIPSGAV